MKASQKAYMIPEWKKNSKFAYARRALNRANFELDRCMPMFLDKTRLGDLEEAIKTKKIIG